MKDTTFDFLQDTAEVAAPKLLGCILERRINDRLLRAKIVETEAYNELDAASHSYKGRTPRTDVMFGPAGHLYVYFTYGMHYCCNVVTGPQGTGSAVLIRALEPLEGQDIMAKRRGDRPEFELTNGPAKLCQAMGIDKRLNGHDLRHSPLKIIIQPTLSSGEIVTTTRIGISKAKETPWRFYIRNNLYVSKI